MLSPLVLPIVCNKYNISCILFDKDFKILEFSDNLFAFASNKDKINIGEDVRDSFWELVGFESKLKTVYENKKEYVLIPMISKNDIFYDINIEICYLEDSQKVYIAMFSRQSNFSLAYLNMMQKINQDNLYHEKYNENMQTKEKYFNLINQKLISFHIDSAGFIIEVNEACSLFFGFTKNQMIGNHFSNYFFSRDIKNSSLTVSSILRAVDLNGIDVFFHTDIIPLNSEKVCNNNIIICQDITYLKKIETELEYAVNHDSLTGLPNRKHLINKLENYIETQKYFALCFIDLDKFKNINDTYGHHAGDMYLKHVGEVLAHLLRENDLVARIGGDEFVMLFEYNDGISYIESTIKRIEAITKEKPLYYNEDIIIPIQYSLGTSIYPQNGKNIQELLAYADEQMYAKKKKK